MAALALHSLTRKLITVGYNFSFSWLLQEWAMPSDSNKDLLYKPGVSHFPGHSAVSLTSVVVTSSNVAHSWGSLVTPAGRVSHLAGSKRKWMLSGNNFGVEKSRRLNQLGCLGWTKETLCLEKTYSGCETHLDFFPKNLTVLVMEWLNLVVLAG